MLKESKTHATKCVTPGLNNDCRSWQGPGRQERVQSGEEASALYGLLDNLRWQLDDS